MHVDVMGVVQVPQKMALDSVCVQGYVILSADVVQRSDWKEAKEDYTRKRNWSNQNETISSK